LKFSKFGLTCGLISSIVNGNRTIFPHIIPDTLSTIKAISAEKCTSLKGAPTIFMDIINHPELEKYDLSSLDTMLIGASTVPKDLILKIKEKLKLKNVIIGYAMTESGCAGGLTNTKDIEVSEKAAYESIGRNFIELKIRDPETGQIVPRNTDGEICLRGYSIMPGYYDDEEKTKETIDRNGWLLTGDIGQMDEQGYIYFKSRAKEIVIRGGVNIYPAEIEAFLRTNPRILDCYVVGVPDERFGEELCVWIKMRPGEKEMTKEEVKQFCQGNIAYFKVPKYVKIVDAFPISATAKVQKFKMIDQMKKELGL
jgi:fatty-acyl-CoA synthase